MNNPRGRNLVRQGAPSTHAARMAGIPVVPPTEDRALYEFMNAVKERLEVRDGGRGNPFEKAVTFRDLKELGLSGEQLPADANGVAPRVLLKDPTGGFVTITVNEFLESIRNTLAYKNLLKRLDDPTRFDSMPPEIQEILVASIAEEAGKRGAALQEIEKTIQTAEKSLAYKIQQTTASLSGSMAGVRSTVFASATQTRAQAGRVTQVQARLDGFNGGTATVETVMTANASRVTGLAAEYYVKLNAGKKAAGFSLAVSEDPTGINSSAFIIQADKFAIVGAAETLADPKNPPATRIPLAIDAITGKIYLTGAVQVDGSLVVSGTITAAQMAANSITAANGAIANLAVTNAKIADLAVTNAKIGDLAVDTLKIGNNAVTIPASSSGGYSASVSLTVPGTDPVDVMLAATFTQGTGRNGFLWSLKVDGASVQDEQPIENTTGGMSRRAYLPAGTHTFAIVAAVSTGSAACGITVLVVRR
jgi:hypothetical protein